MNFTVHDPNNWLSQRQKQKVKKLVRDQFREGKREYDEVLPNLHFEDPAKQYHSVMLEEEQSISGYKIVFKEKTNREELRSRLRAKVGLKVSGRIPHHEKGEDWEMYYKMIQHPSLSMVPAEKLALVVPKPPDVRKHTTLYQQMQSLNPNPLLRQYFELCWDQKM